jgi:hypothetical protein
MAAMSCQTQGTNMPPEKLAPYRVHAFLLHLNQAGQISDTTLTEIQKDFNASLADAEAKGYLAGFTHGHQKGAESNESTT